jgi:hypothetical protein
MLGLLATAAFLGSGVLIASWVIPKDDAVAPAPRAGGAVKKKPAKAKPSLTKAQIKQRKAAVAKLSGDGYEAVSLRDWRPKGPLKVLLGRNDAGAMRAFFFNGATFIGYDDPATSNHVRVVHAGREDVTLAYRVSTGDPQKVKFSWVDGTLQHDVPVPPSSIR